MILNQYTCKEIEKLLSIINRHRFLILKGATGTGKTLYAHALACLLTYKNKMDSTNPTGIEEKYRELLQNGQVRNVIFHKGTDRENLVYGISARTEKGKMKYQPEHRAFLQMVCAAEQNTEKPFVLILEDIGRADFSRAMGDIFSALESDDAGNVIHADKDYRLPENLYIIATYDPTVARSTVDYAWFRRFFVYELTADERYIIEDRKQINDNNSIFVLDQDGKPERFINCSEEEKLLEYIYVIFMHTKLLFERYFVDPAVRSMYLPGHGMFLLNDDAKDFAENIQRFHYRLKHTIVPLLYHYLHCGLLTPRAELDIALLDHLWEDGYWKIALSVKTESGDYRPIENEIIRMLIDQKNFPLGISYFFFLRNPLLMRKGHEDNKTGYHDDKRYFLFEKDGEQHKDKRPGKRQIHSNEDYHQNKNRIVISQTRSTKKQILCSYLSFDSNNPKKEKHKEIEDYDGKSGQVYSPQIFLKLIKTAIRLTEIKRIVCKDCVGVPGEEKMAGCLEKCCEAKEKNRMESLMILKEACCKLLDGHGETSGE